MPKKYCPNCEHAILYDDQQEGEEATCPQCLGVTILDGVTVDGGESYKRPELPLEQEIYVEEVMPPPLPKSAGKSADVPPLPGPLPEDVPAKEPAAVTSTAAPAKNDRGLIIGIAMTLMLVGAFFVYIFVEEMTKRERKAQQAKPAQQESVVQQAPPTQARPAPGRPVVPAAKRPAPAPPARLNVEFPQLPETVAPNQARLQDQRYQEYVQVGFMMPYRLFGNTVVDLRSLSYAVRHGVMNFPDGWNFLAAKVESKQTRALVARLDPQYHGEARLVYLTNAPGLESLQLEADIGVLAKARGRHQVQAGAAVGPVSTMDAYDFGTVPSDLMIARAQEEATKRDAALRAERAKVMQAAADKQRKEAEERKMAKDRRAVASLERRIKQGSSSAEYSLGLRYLNGLGVPKDKAKGMKLLESAARKKNTLAIRKLKELKGG